MKYSEYYPPQCSISEVRLQCLLATSGFDSFSFDSNTEIDDLLVDYDV